MIKATIQNGPQRFSEGIMRAQEIVFPCLETELSDKLGELGMDKEHLSPMATVLEIEPSKLSMLVDSEVSLDALNYLGKHMDGMERRELNKFLAVLSCDELDKEWDMKSIINLTFKLPRYTLIEDTSDLEHVGLIHMLDVRKVLSESEYNNSEWLKSEGQKLLDSGKGISTDYGLLFVNEEISFEEVFNGKTFPPYYCNPNAIVTAEISYGDLTELAELPCEEIAIKKALYRLGAESISDCEVSVETTQDISDEWSAKMIEVEKTKDLFELNSLLKSEDIRLKREQPAGIFKQEIARRLNEEGYNFSFENGEFSVISDGDVIKIRDNDVMYSEGAFSQSGKDKFHALYRLFREVLDCCSAYEKAAPLTADGLSEKYRCLAEFGDAVLAAKYNEEYGFEFVTWFLSSDRKSVCNGNYFSDYGSAKENFSIRSGLISKNKLFSEEELEQIRNCVSFTAKHNSGLRLEDCEFLNKLNEKISENIPKQQSCSPEMSM